MKPLYWTVACLTILLPQAGSSQDTRPARLSVPAITPSGRATLFADEIVREDPPRPAPSPYASVIRLKGHVEIRICCVSLPSSKSNTKPAATYLVMRAAEARYHDETGEIEARGDVHLDFQHPN